MSSIPLSILADTRRDKQVQRETAKGKRQLSTLLGPLVCWIRYVHFHFYHANHFWACLDFSFKGAEEGQELSFPVPDIPESTSGFSSQASQSLLVRGKWQTGKPSPGMHSSLTICLQQQQQQEQADQERLWTDACQTLNSICLSFRTQREKPSS